MDIKELKHMIKNSTSVLVLDGGEPSFVILDYAAYKKLLAHESNHATVQAPSSQAPTRSALDPRETEILERLNKEILAIKAQIEAQERIADEGEDLSGL